MHPDLSGFESLILIQSPKRNLRISCSVAKHSRFQFFSSIKANPPVDVSDLTEEIKDGQILLTLVEVLLGVKVSRETKKNRISYIKNVQEAMRILARNKVQTCLNCNKSCLARAAPPVQFVS